MVGRRCNLPDGARAISVPCWDIVTPVIVAMTVSLGVLFNHIQRILNGFEVRYFGFVFFATNPNHP